MSDQSEQETYHGGIPPDNIHHVGGREKDGSPTYIGPWTFRTGMVRRVVEDAIHGRTLNACAGKTKLSIHAASEIIRNDLNPEMDADFHHDVTQIDELFPPNSFDAVVFDPPYDQTQADEHYDGMHDRDRGPARQKLATLVRVGGTFVELGWNLHSIADQSGDWDDDPPHLFRRGPSYRPVFLTIDHRNQMTLGDGDD